MSSAFKIQIATSMEEIDAAEWDGCANPLAAETMVLDPQIAAQQPPETASAAFDPSAREERFNPFISHAFLKALETSKSVSSRAGWTPSHVLVRDSAGRLAAAAPAYLKTHSMGEYVFDHAWADAYERAGLEYYPKLQVAAPFTPVTGRRLLIASDQGDGAGEALIAGLRAWRAKIGASSIHVTFPTETEWDRLGAAGFLQRVGQQFHFVNKAYADFDAFLDDLASRKRKMIRRERKEALAHGIEIELLTGAAIKETHWDSIFLFYMNTGARKWGKPYLNRAFFSLIGAAMADHILLVMAKRGGVYIAGAINFIGKDALYGRYWGGVEEHPFLHFEVCYYQAIEFAIAQKFSRVEAGAQGEHKLARGYVAAPTFSAHDIADKRFANAIDQYLEKERALVDASLEEYQEMTPFRRAP